MHGLFRSPPRATRLAVGLMSGSSADGVDAALVRIREVGGRLSVRVLAARTEPYPAGWRRRLIAASEADVSLREAAELDVRLGERFAAAAQRLLLEAGVSAARVDVIGAHGHTLLHQSRRAGGVACSYQAASGDVIAERTGVPTVTGFRGRDQAAGGEGAPLVPFVDSLLFGADGRTRALQNIGGIANVTLVTGEPEATIAFDTGPGNAMIDHAVRLATRGRRRFDRDGRMAAAGVIHRTLLARLHAHPFFARPVPRSTGRETFGARWTEALAAGRISGRDLVATLTRFTAESIARAYEAHLFPRARPREILVSGGGAHNATLMRHLAELACPIPVRRLARHGIDADNKEAVAFAVLAHETVRGRPANLPPATGARRPVVLGRISL